MENINKKKWNFWEWKIVSDVKSLWVKYTANLTLQKKISCFECITIEIIWSENQKIVWLGKKKLPQSFDELWEILKCNWSPSVSGRKIILRNNAENHPDLQSSMNPKQGKHKECHIKAHYHQIAAVWW